MSKKKSVAVVIRPIKTVEEYHTCEDIQKQVWQFADREIIPANELITIQRTGGLVLGAFLGRKMVGFAFGFAGLQDGKLIHSSRMLAVLPGYRNYDIGYRLKLAQRAFALKQGIKLITWTFDPLQSLNAFFNIVKLGVTVRRYFANLYGASSSVLNKGVPTDRFLAEWAIDSRCVKQKFTHKSAIRNQFTLSEANVQSAIINVVNHTSHNKKGLVVSSDGQLDLRAPAIAVAIPYDFNRILRRDNKLAIDWRLKTRKIFTHYFSKGYRVDDVFTSRLDDQTGRTSFYIMRRKP